MKNSEYIGLDEFDRKYRLDDLLPAAVAADFLDEVKEDIAAAIMLPDGRTYYGEPAISAGQLADARKDLNPSAANFGTYLQDKEPVVLFALVHELEIIGYLTMHLKSRAFQMQALITSFGRCIARMLNRIIYLNYKNKMATGLHGQVVEESYTRLKEKAAQLQQSEEKYRCLAQNLEIEVGPSK